MTNATQVMLVNGVLSGQSGTVSTLDNLPNLGIPIVDGTTGTIKAAVKAASTAPVATDPALVVAISPNQSTLAVAQDTANIANGATGTNLTPLFATIVASSSGATTIVAAVGGKRIRVLSWYLKCNAAVNFKWQSHVTPTDLTGLLYNSGQGDGVGAAFSPIGHFQTVSGEALDINLSGAVAVGGYLVYVTV